MEEAKYISDILKLNKEKEIEFADIKYQCGCRIEINIEMNYVEETYCEEHKEKRNG